MPPGLARALRVAAVVLPAVAAVVALWPVLDNGFVSDDFWWGTLLDQSVSDVDVDWSEVLREFTGPWLGGEVGQFYRPLVSVAFGINFELGGGSALPFHVWNLTQHALSSALVAVLCMLCCPARPALAALAGGMLVALHPSAVEPVAWCSGATSTQEVLFRNATLASFAWFLSSGRPFAYAGALGLTALTLFTKESGLMLPVSILFVNLLHPRRTTLSAALAFLFPFVLLCGGYLGVRWLLPGLTLGTGNTPGTFVAELAQSLPSKLGALLLPFGTEGSLLARPGTWLAAALLVAFSARAWWIGRWLLPAAVAWVFVQLLPSSSFTVQPTYFGSRMVYGVVASIALVLCHAFCARPTRPLVLTGFVLLAAGTSLALARFGLSRVAAYEEADHDMEQLGHALEAAAGDVSVEAPLAVLAAVPERNGILRVAPAVLFAVAERPRARVDVPIVNLAFVLERTSDSGELFQDASPLRAMKELGARITSWDARRGSFFYEPPVREGVSELLREGATWKLAAPLDPYRVEGVRVRVRGGGNGGRLTWLGAVPDLRGDAPLGAGARRGDATDYLLDLTHDLPLLSSRLAGGVAGFDVALENGGEILSVEVVERLPRLELPQRLHGSDVAIEDIERRLGSVRGVQSRLVLLSPTAGHVLGFDENGRLVVPDRVRLSLLWLLRNARQRHCYYWYETDGARSEVDRFRLVQRRPRQRWRRLPDTGGPR